MKFRSLNGKLFPVDQPLLRADNRGYRYGDGLFETMKMINGDLLLAEFHFDRFFNGLSLLQYQLPTRFTRDSLLKDIQKLAGKNKEDELARIRVSAFRGNGGLYDTGDQKMQYIIETWPLPETCNSLNENGLIIDHFSGMRKSTDVYANLKSANFLPYTLAALDAREKKVNDCVLLSLSDELADSSIANLFIIKDEVICTPPLSSGCVAGVSRRYILEAAAAAGFRIEERSLSLADLEKADEVFLSNAIYGLRWVQRYADSLYQNRFIQSLYMRIFKTILWT